LSQNFRQKCWCPRVFGVPRNLGEKFGSKIFSPKFEIRKNLRPQKNFRQKKCLSKKFWIKKGPKSFFGPEKFLTQKI
jgi:hypothetical protein